MAENSGIEWTDNTFNPLMGCTKVSPACKNCYAERDFDHRYGKVQWGPNGTRVLTSLANWRKPIKWNRDAASANACNCNKCSPLEDHHPSCNAKHQTRPRVFCASLADVFEDWSGPIQDSNGERLYHSWTIGGPWIPESKVESSHRSPVTMHDVRARLFALIDTTPHLDWLLLTKRPENIVEMWGDPVFRPNVWLGCSVENQEYADKRIPELLKSRALSPVLFLSCEPLLGPVEFSNVTNRSDAIEQLGKKSLGGIDWVIAGGESGPGARPSNPEWFRSLRDQCAAAEVPYHFKQWGEFDAAQVRVGKKNAGRLLDGRTHDGLPAQQPAAARRASQ